MKIPDSKRWYISTVDHLEQMMKDFVVEEGAVPFDVQKTVIDQVHSIVINNLDNQNKHLFEGEEAEGFLWRLGEILSYIDDEVILDPSIFKMQRKDDVCYRWVYLILKYKDQSIQYDFVKSFDEEKNAQEDSGIEGEEDDEQVEEFIRKGKTGSKNSVSYILEYHGAKGALLEKQTADVQFMDVIDNKLVIEGRLSPVLLMNDSEFGIWDGNIFRQPEYQERYAHTKAFGVTIFKRYAFKFEIPLTGQTQDLRFVTCGKWGECGVTIQFDSHFSRVSKRFPHGYWHMTKKLVMYPDKTNLLIKKKRALWLRELQLWLDMLTDKKKEARKYILVRLFLHSRKIWKHKPIWLFIDKIYKGGDSSEYLYRFAKQQQDGICKYYLIDKDCPDYDRLKKDGYKPLVRRSLKHRIIFFAADMIVISNSTVYAFNDMSMRTTAYIRDLMNFHTVCVQHGMSVQKIAVAQNRLRDNLRLYFCASKYEIENLLRPIYGYENTNALQLTGVPRYDGLVNRDKKQILISPTWRMQAAVKVRKNEGVARDYNPDFKETSYYRVYNSLINDERLISAAQQYGYRIAYVLHPIVSPQVDDFDRNDYVDIIPAIGDMSYEQMFCESSLMVTDYSGIQFDFAYMRKPLVYLHHRDIPQHYEEGTYHYDTMSFGEICHDNDELIDLLCEYMATGCKMKPEYVRRADDFFAFNDHNNCQRIYDVMLDYQKNIIDARVN